MPRNLSKMVSRRAMLSGLGAAAGLGAIIIVPRKTWPAIPIIGKTNAPMLPAIGEMKEAIIPGIGACAGFMLSSGLPSLNKTFIETLTDLGLTTNLKLCLDAGDIASAPSGATSWLDTSGNGFDFFRGTTAAGQSTDPTFNGTAGNRSSSEYWSFDGGDFFTYDTTNETWMQNLHKDNATVSVACWIYSKAQAAAANEHQTIFTTVTDHATDTGVAFRLQPSNSSLPGSVAWVVEDAGADAAFFTSAPEGLAATDDQWNFVGFALDEAADSARYRVNGSAAAEAASVVYSSPATGSATETMTIGAQGDAGFSFDSGTRLAMLAIWEGTALTAANLEAIYQATRGRFGV